MKKLWRIGIAFGVFFLALCIYVPVCAEERFEGSRVTVCSISQSDLENFVSGGRSALEMILRQNEEDWYAVSIESEGRELFIYLKYSFESFDEYLKETTQLIGSEPITTYGEENVSYIENFSPSELFHFLNYAMQKEGIVQENYFAEALEVRKDTMKLNGEEYIGTRALNLSGESKIMFDNISVNTTFQEEKYTRKLDLILTEDGTYSASKMLDERCEKMAAESVQDEREYTVSFTADSESELIKKTMVILGTAVDITHKKHPGTVETVRLETKEWIDVDWLLSEEGEYFYRMEYPKEYQTLSADLETTKDENVKEEYDAEGDELSVTGQTISYEGKGRVITWYYDIPLCFDKVTVMTDLSDRAGKMERTVVFYMDWDIADSCHEAVKEKLRKRMDRGDVLRIHDDQGYRQYEVSHISWTDADVEKFSERILRADKCIFSSKKSIIPFVKSYVEDNIEFGEVETYSEEVYAEYIFPEQNNEEVVSERNFQTDLTFRGFYYVKLAGCILAVLVVAAAFLGMIYMAGRYYKEKVKREWKAQKNCPVCGASRKKKEKFCGKCGYKF